MMQGIDITPVGAEPKLQDSANRISRLLEVAFSESEWIHRCEGQLAVSQFIEHPARVAINGVFSGTANGQEFLISFDRDYIISDDVSASAWLRSPIFALFMTGVRTFRNEQDPTKNAGHWISRSEFEIASELEAKINKIVGAPVEGVRFMWRNSLIAGFTLLLLATSIMTFYTYTHPHPRHLDDGPLGRFMIALMGGMLFAGVPSGLGGVFLGLTFIGSEIEDSVAGQSLLRLVGVKSAKGLRMVSIVGAIVCLGVVAASARMLMLRG